MKIKKLAVSLLLTACTLGCACGDKNGGPKTEGVITEPEYLAHYVDGTLHDVNVDYDTPISDFVVNGQTNYKIVALGSNTSTAAGFLTQQVYKATGVTIEIVEEISTSDIDQNTQYILMGAEDVYIELGGEMSSYETLGPAGYDIVTYGKNVFINAYGIQGYQLGTICFLRQTLGYDMLSEDCIIFERDGSIIPAMNITERPDYDYRQQGGSCTTAETYGMGYTHSSIFINTGSSWMHNWWDFVSPEFVEAEEAKGNNLPANWLSVDPTRWQGCWTARGNQEAYLGLIDHLTEKVKGFLIASPHIDNIIIGQHDVADGTPSVNCCRCVSCKASNEYYGTMSGAWLSLCNRVSNNVAAWLDTDEAISIFGENKAFNLVQLTYGASINAPAQKDDEGNYVYENGVGVPMQEVWFNENGEQEQWVLEDENGETIVEFGTGKRLYCADNVQILYAAASANYTHSFYETENAFFSNLARAWAGFGAEFYIWAYSNNFHNLLYPYNTFDTSWETTRFYKAMGAKYFFWQGQYENKNNTGFTKLRNYLDSKVEFDVNSDYTYYLNKFFKYFYGEGGEYMKQFFDEVTMHCRYNEIVNKVPGGIHASRYGDAANWPQGLLVSWMDLMDKAYAAVEHYKTTNPNLYESYNKHILIETMFPRYALCTSYADNYSELGLKEMRRQFVNDCTVLKFTSHKEHYVISEVFAGWDLD